MITIGESVFIGIVTFIFGTLFGYGIGSWNKFAVSEENDK